MVVVSLLFDLGRFPSVCIQCTNLENQLGCAVFVSKADVTVPYEPFPISFRSEYLYSWSKDMYMIMDISEMFQGHKGSTLALIVKSVDNLMQAHKCFTSC